MTLRDIPEKYIPGFKELTTDKFSGIKIYNRCNELGVPFQRLILPGDPLYIGTEKFSMSSSEDMIYNILNGLQEETRIKVHSLSSWPLILALKRILEENPDARDLIKSVVLLNPAKDPLHAVKIMDWILREGNGEIMTNDYFLKGIPDEVYKILIDGWEGDGQTFQKDLNQMRTGEDFDEIVQHLTNKYRFSIIDHSNQEDIVTNGNFPTVTGKRGAISAMRGHIAKGTGVELLNLGY